MKLIRLMGKMNLVVIGLVSILWSVPALGGCNTDQAVVNPPSRNGQPTVTTNDSQIAQLIRQLGDDDWPKREAAQTALEDWPADKLSEIEPALQEAAQSKDPDVKMRAKAILKKIKPFTLLGANPQGYKEYRHEQTGMVFVLIPAGSFQMGSNESDDEKPIHDVTLNSFLISKYETTQGVWQKIMGSDPSKFKGDNNPVEQVSWDDCQYFCKKAGLRLPTEAEWEYAARAGTTTKYYWGDKEDGDYMWYSANLGNTTHPVGQKKPNVFGLYDMSGNVWEWCQDWYGKNYYGSSPKSNPTGPGSGQGRVLRGGSWGDLANLCRSALRLWRTPASRLYTYGFRCVQDLR